jgi:hypothetical protein
MRNKPFIPNERRCFPETPPLPRSAEAIKPWCFPERPGDPDDEGCFPESPARGRRRPFRIADLARLL